MQLPERWIAHLDMDAFYASVELLRYPQLKGEAVVIGGRRADAPRQREDGSWQYARLRDYTGRGVITTSTYEARALGVFSAMGTMKAAALALVATVLFCDLFAIGSLNREAKVRLSIKLGSGSTSGVRSQRFSLESFLYPDLFCRSL